LGFVASLDLKGLLTSHQARFHSLEFVDSQLNEDGALLAQTCRRKIIELNGVEYWQKLVAGKSAISMSVAVYDAIFLKIGEEDLHFDCAASPASRLITVAQVKQILQQTRRIDWSDAAYAYTLCVVRDGNKVSIPDDSDDHVIEWGSELMLYPASPSKVLLLPPVMFALPADSIEIGGFLHVPVNVRARQSATVLYTQLQMPVGSTVESMKRCLVDSGIEWAVRASKVHRFDGAPMNSASVIPSSSSCYPLHVVQTSP
jgi:hypothetical protein